MEIIQPDSLNIGFLMLQLLLLAIRTVIGPIPGLELLLGVFVLGL